MQITIDLPEELIQHFNRDRLASEILEALVIQAYQTEKITHAELGRILGLRSRWAVDAFLKQHNVDLHYDKADLERDRGVFGKQSAPSTDRDQHSMRVMVSLGIAISS